MKRKSTLLLYALLIIIMISTACSKRALNDNLITPSDNPATANGSLSDLSIIPTQPVIPSSAAQPSDAGKMASNLSASEDNANNTDSTNTVNGNIDGEIDSFSTCHKLIAIDAGHQSRGNYDTEPIGPGASVKKPKVSSGTSGNYTGVAEYKLNLIVAKKVKEELIRRGYKVYMIRETNNVNLSNKKRADMANKSGADIFIRIHADSSTDHSVHGTSTLYPSKRNPFVPKLSHDSYALSKSIVNSISDSTGSKNRGAIARDDMSGINWSKIPVSIIEMGYMSNKNEDKLMQTNSYQNKIVKGICDGIDDYFN